MRKRIKDCRNINTLLAMQKNARKKIKNAENRIVDTSIELEEIELRIEQVGFENANQMRLPGM